MIINLSLSYIFFNRFKEKFKYLPFKHILNLLDLLEPIYIGIQNDDYWIPSTAYFSFFADNRYYFTFFFDFSFFKMCASIYQYVVLTHRWQISYFTTLPSIIFRCNYYFPCLTIFEIISAETKYFLINYFLM